MAPVLQARGGTHRQKATALHNTWDGWKLNCPSLHVCQAHEAHPPRTSCTYAILWQRWLSLGPAAKFGSSKAAAYAQENFSKMANDIEPWPKVLRLMQKGKLPVARFGKIS